MPSKIKPEKNKTRKKAKLVTAEDKTGAICEKSGNPVTSSQETEKNPIKFSQRPRGREDE